MPNKVLTLQQVIALTSLSRSYIYNQIQDKDDPFPSPIKLGLRKICFIESEINEWLESKIAESRGAK